MQVDSYFFFGNRVDDSNHGTHVASTLAGSPWDPKTGTPFDPLVNPDYATGVFSPLIHTPHTHTYTPTHMHTYTCTHARKRTCIHSCMYTNAHPRHCTRGAPVFF